MIVVVLLYCNITFSVNVKTKISCNFHVQFLPSRQKSSDVLLKQDGSKKCTYK